MLDTRSKAHINQRPKRGLTPSIDPIVPTRVGPDIQTPPRFEKMEPRVITISLATANTDVEWRISGTVLWFMNSTNLTDLVKVRYHRKDADQLLFLPGNAIQMLPFERLYFTNAIIAGATATFVIFNEQPGNPLLLR